MIDSKFGPSTSNPGAEIDDSANEVIMTQEEFDRFNSKCNNHHHGLHNHGYHGKRSNCGKIVEPVITEGKTYHHDKNGKIFASSGRGGAGNIAKFDKVPTAKIESEKQEIELSPVFSTGRGGAGNIYRTKSHTKTKIPLNTEITDQLSPLHSNRSGKSGKSSRSTENPIEPIHETKESNKFMKKFKSMFK